MVRSTARNSGLFAFVAARIALSALAALAILGAPERAAAQNETYEACLEEARDDPARARETAAKWEAIGGGAQAKHCGAIALIGLGAEARAAELLTDVGSGPGGELGALDRAAALLLAGDIWLRLGQPELAAKTYEGAATLDPQSAEAMIGQARAAAGRTDFEAAEIYLNRALRLRPNDPRALILRAAARRKLGNSEQALADAASALKINRGAPIGWFEKGMAEKALGQTEAAQESFLIASQLDPVGAVGDLAREQVQRMILGE